MRLVDIGRTAEGRAQYMAILSSPENLARLDHWREISERLAHADGVSKEEARRLAQEGRAIVWIDGGLHATETVGSQQLMELVWEMVSGDDPRDAPASRRRGAPGGAGESGRAGPRRELVHAQAGREGALDDGPAGALPPLHRARQQPRLLHVEHARDDEHEPGHVPRVVPADRLQPPSAGFRADGRRRVRAAVPRPVQLRLRPAGAAADRAGRRGHERAPGRARHARLGAAQLLELLHLVERRPADDHVLPQHDRPADGDHRQPHAGPAPVRRRDAASDQRLAGAGAAADVALPPVDRLRDAAQPGRARLRVQEPRDAALRHVAQGHEPDRAGKRRLLDDHARPGRRRRGGRRRRARRARPQRLRAAHRAVREGAPRSGAPRSARLCHPRGPAGLRAPRRSS